MLLQHWTKWRLDRRKVSSRPERFIIELAYKLGRKKLLLAKEQFPFGVDYSWSKKKKADYILRPAVYRTLHGISHQEAFLDVLQSNARKPTSKG